MNLVRSHYLDFSGEMFARFQLGHQAIEWDISTCHYPFRWCWTVSVMMTTSPSPWASCEREVGSWRLATWLCFRSDVGVARGVDWIWLSSIVCFLMLRCKLPNESDSSRAWVPWKDISILLTRASMLGQLGGWISWYVTSKWCVCCSFVSPIHMSTVWTFGRYLSYMTFTCWESQRTYKQLSEASVWFGVTSRCDRNVLMLGFDVEFWPLQMIYTKNPWMFEPQTNFHLYIYTYPISSQRICQTSAQFTCAAMWE